jgi:tRNA pseudouridine38-40 synthase
LELSGMNRNLFLWLEYEGTGYQGWQRQSAGPTVQGEVERMLAEVVGHRVGVHAAGRTDAGVHALGQAAHCLADTPLPCRAILHETNRRLADDIVVRHVAEAPPEFRARRHAVMRHYRYQLLNRRIAPSVDRRTWAHVAAPLDRRLLAEAVALYAGHHEFAAFRSSACRARRTALTMVRSRLTIEGDRIVMDFACRSFLHNMVRVMVGTALDAARGRIDPETIRRLLAGEGDRSLGGKTASARGLVLVGVEYGEPYGRFGTLADGERPLAGGECKTDNG